MSYALCLLLLTANQIRRTLFLRDQFLIGLIGLRSHNKIITVQTSDLMRPPANSNLAPFRKESRMMSLFLSQCPDLVSKRKSCNKILKLVNAFQALNTLTLNNIPIWYLLAILGSFFGSHFWSTNATGFTLHLCQLF